MTQVLTAKDKTANCEYARGKIQQWDLAMREFQNEYRQSTGKEPSKEALDHKFHSVCHLTTWVDDPEFGQPCTFTQSQVRSIRTALAGLPQLRRQFEAFLAKHTVVD